MKGNFGVYNSKSQILRVEGNVNLTNMSSIQFLTSEAFFDFRKEILFSDQNVTGKKDGSLITAEGFKILNKKNKIIFSGKSKLILNKQMNLIVKIFITFYLLPYIVNSQQIINQKQNGGPIEIYAEKVLNGIRMIINTWQ